MAKYYELIAGLPELSVEQSAVSLSSKKYLEILGDTLTFSDKKILEVITLDNTIKDIIDIIFKGSVDAIPLDFEQDIKDLDSVLNLELNDIRYRAENSLTLDYGIYSIVPSFVGEVIYNMYSGNYDENKKDLLVIHNIYVRYYEMAQKSNNDFLSEWFSLNKNIKNIISLFVCEKLGWNPSDFILGSLPIDDKIRESNTSNINNIEDIDYLSDVIAIAKESNITKRERLIDLVNWRFLERYNFDDVFGIENVICYYIKLCILERWINLNEMQGETKFRDIVASLKETSKISLQEFKNKQRK